MAESPTRKSAIKSQSNENSSESEKLEITVIYSGKEYRLRFSEDTESKAICQEIKRETGVRGAFYLHYGDKAVNNYLHSSSLTRGNIAKLTGKVLEIRGGDWINKGGDSIWYYNSQTPREDVRKKLRDIQFVPFDCPP